jgi:hypothetical protein
MPFTAYEFNKPVTSPNGEYHFLAGEKSEQSMGGAYVATCYLWQKGHPIFPIHYRCAGLGVWSEDGQIIYFPIWYNTPKDAFLMQRLAAYNISKGELIIYETQYSVLELKVCKGAVLTAILSPYFQPTDLEIDMTQETRCSISDTETPSLLSLPFLKHEDYYQEQHPLLNIENTNYTNEPISEIYVEYCLQCHVNNENDKLFYNEQMLALFEVLNPLINNWKFTRVMTDVALNRLYLRSKKDEIRITGKFASNGGRKNKYTLANVQKVSTLHIANNPNLVFDFNNPGVQDRSIWEQNPQGLPHVFRMEIYGRKNNILVPNWTFDYCTPMHFYLQWENPIYNHKGIENNQSVNIWMPHSLMPSHEMDNLVRKIGKIAHATKIYKNETAQQGVTYENEEGNITTTYRPNEHITEAINGKNRYGRDWTAIIYQ